jgi:hypothetical protein
MVRSTSSCERTKCWRSSRQAEENEINSWQNRLCTAMPHGRGFFAG